MPCYCVKQSQALLKCRDYESQTCAARWCDLLPSTGRAVKQAVCERVCIIVSSLNVLKYSLGCQIACEDPIRSRPHACNRGCGSIVARKPSRADVNKRPDLPQWPAATFKNQHAQHASLNAGFASAQKWQHSNHFQHVYAWPLPKLA